MGGDLLVSIRDTFDLRGVGIWDGMGWARIEKRNVCYIPSFTLVFFFGSIADF